MKIINAQDFKWYRYLGQQPIVLPDAHADYDIEIDSRDVVGFRFDERKKKYFLLHIDLLEEELNISEHDTQLCLKTSRPYKGKVNGKEVPLGVDFEELAVNKVARSNTLRIKNPKNVNPHGRAASGNDLVKDVPVRYTPITGRKRPKQIKLELRSIGGSIERFPNIKPLDRNMLGLLEEASHYIGIKVPIKTSAILLGMSEIDGTMLLTQHSRGNNKVITMNINKRQLASLNNGVFDASILAQAITHELGHYILNEGVVKTTDKMRWKKQLAGLRFHKDQYNHGQGYPWFDEHFAMMCEYVVHGRSARTLQAIAGWEIVEKYFDNVYLEGGG